MPIFAFGQLHHYRLLTLHRYLLLRTEQKLNLFVRLIARVAFDMVVVVDGSGSMDLQDYETTNGRVQTRLEGARTALDIL